MSSRKGFGHELPEGLGGRSFIPNPFRRVGVERGNELFGVGNEFFGGGNE